MCGYSWSTGLLGRAVAGGIMQVSEILSLKGSTLFTVTPDKMLSECVVTMAENDIGSLVVMDNGKLAGMLTFREVLKVLAKRQLEQRSGPTRPVAEIVVRDVMVPNPLVVSPDTEVNELRRMMLDSHTRYVPVMDGDTLMGIVSFHDVARAVLEEQGFENRMLKAYIRDWPAEG
jgi:CBS domain-containing protein